MAVNVRGVARPPTTFATAGVPAVTTGAVKRGAVTSSDRAELDSALSTLNDVMARVSAAADRHARDADESVTSDLYEVERALQAAARRLAVVVRHLGG